MKRIFKILFAFIAIFAYNCTASVTGANYETYDDDDADEVVTELLGIEAIMRGKTFDTRNVFSKIQRARKRAERMKKRKNLYASATRRQKYIVGNKKRLAPNIQNLIEGGNAEFKEGFIYFVHQFTAAISGNNKIIRSGDSVDTGFSNLLQNGKVPSHKSYAIDFIALENSVDAAAGTIDWEAFQSIRSSANALMGADLEIKINNEVVTTIPVFLMNEGRIHDGGQTTIYNAKFGAGINLEKPIMINGDDTVQASLNLPSGESVAVANGHSIRVIMQGTEISQRG
jgi:hypothetical protein